MNKQTEPKSEILTSEAGFTLIEVILTMGILLSLTIVATNVIKNSIDMRTDLSIQINTNHRLINAMDRLTNDLEHAFIVSRKRPEGFNPQRRTKTLFRIKPGERSELAFTTLSRLNITKNSGESDQTFVFYELRQDDETGRTNLYRGEADVLPENFSEVKATTMIAKDIKVFDIKGWNGTDFSKNSWNSDSSSQRDLLPKMVSIRLEAWDFAHDADIGEGVNIEDLTTELETAIYLPLSYHLDTEKTPVSSFKERNL